MKMRRKTFRLKILLSNNLIILTTGSGFSQSLSADWPMNQGNISEANIPILSGLILLMTMAVAYGIRRVQESKRKPIE